MTTAVALDALDLAALLCSRVCHDLISPTGAIVCASSRSICAPAEPAAPNASRQNCRRVDAVLALFLMRSRAKSLVS